MVLRFPRTHDTLQTMLSGSRRVRLYLREVLSLNEPGSQFQSVHVYLGASKVPIMSDAKRRTALQNYKACPSLQSIWPEQLQQTARSFCIGFLH